MEFKDYYTILGVDAKADLKTIKTAYRKLARKYHPDMNAEKGAEEKFKEVAEAYQVLKNEQLRTEFDELRQYGSQSQQGFRPPPGWQASRKTQQEDAHFQGDFSDFFNSIFGGHSQSQAASSAHQTNRQTRGQDIEIEVPVTLEETLKENPKTIEFWMPADEYNSSVPSKKRIKVKIPREVGDGERIRLKGQGKPGFQNGTAGDLYLHIRVRPHPLFDVHGKDITITIPVSPWEAALGTKINVATLEGSINLTIPPDSQSGDKLRVKGKGLKSKTLIGDMFAIVKVTMPLKTSEKGKQLWKALAASETFNPRLEWSKR